jgi:hypothetical protein
VRQGDESDRERGFGEEDGPADDGTKCYHGSEVEARGASETSRPHDAHEQDERQIDAHRS